MASRLVFLDQAIILGIMRMVAALPASVVHGIEGHVGRRMLVDRRAQRPNQPATYHASSATDMKVPRKVKGLVKDAALYGGYVVNALVHPRRFHAHCVGGPKSGTHSVADVFGAYRAAHEPESWLLVDTMEAAANGTLGPRDLTKFFRKRDKRLWLELESSHLTGRFVDILVREFRDAKFILTIRDCYSWLNSEMNDQVNHPNAPGYWRRMRNVYFRASEFRHAEEERELAEHGLYTLDGYLSYWASHNDRVLTAVPPDKLLIVRTHEIKDSLRRIAEFLDIPAEQLDHSQAHQYRAKKQHGLLARLDPEYVESKVDRYCRPLMDRFFPEVRSVRDVITV